MPRYKLVLEYYGKPFVGWQRQENGPSVQAALEAACKALSGEEAVAQAAGRTDAGVHALGMVVHIDLAKGLAADVVLNALNHLLKPAPIAVVAAEIVDDEFHARFSCTRRSYEYRIINRRAPLTIEAGRAWHVTTPLDAEAMDAAAQILLGHHDFTTFRTTVCQANSPEKTLDELSVSRAGGEVVIRCAARSFLHHQVRSITGSLVEVGRGRWRASDLKAALEARDRARCGVVAPPDGLYFLHADYTNKK